MEEVLSHQRLSSPVSLRAAEGSPTHWDDALRCETCIDFVKEFHACGAPTNVFFLKTQRLSREALEPHAHVIHVRTDDKH